MTKKQKEYLKEKILKDIENLINEIEDLKEKNKPIPPENSFHFLKLQKKTLQTYK